MFAVWFGWPNSKKFSLKHFRSLNIAVSHIIKDVSWKKPEPAHWSYAEVSLDAKIDYWRSPKGEEVQIRTLAHSDNEYVFTDGAYIVYFRFAKNLKHKPIGLCILTDLRPQTDACNCKEILEFQD